MSVCDNQDDFNMAVHQAVQYNEKAMLRDSKPYVGIYIALWFIFFIWAIILAMKVPAGRDRIEHVMFAVLFSPVYVVANYLGVWNSASSEIEPVPVSFGMCGSCGGCGM